MARWSHCLVVVEVTDWEDEDDEKEVVSMMLRKLGYSDQTIATLRPTSGDDGHDEENARLYKFQNLGAWNSNGYLSGSYPVKIWLFPHELDMPWGRSTFIRPCTQFQIINDGKAIGEYEIMGENLYHVIDVGGLLIGIRCDGLPWRRFDGFDAADAYISTETFGEQMNQSAVSRVVTRSATRTPDDAEEIAGWHYQHDE